MFPSMTPPVFLPANTSMRVVFPAPLTPTNAVRTPGLNAPVTSTNSCNLSSTIPCCFNSWSDTLIRKLSSRFPKWHEEMELYTHHRDIHIVIHIAESHREWLEWENHAFLLKMFCCQEVNAKLNIWLDFDIITEK